MNDLHTFFQGKRVLVTGHSGFMGAWLAYLLILLGANVSGVALRPPTTPNLFSILKLRRSLNHYIADIRNAKKLQDIFSVERPEIVFHLAAQPIVRESYENPLYTFETNIIGTANVLHAIKMTASVRAGILVTTDKVYEENLARNVYFQEHHPLGGHDPYSASKAGAEIVIRSYIRSFFTPDQFGKTHEILVSSARVGNVLGGGDWAKDRIIPDLVHSASENCTLVIRNPDFVRPWQHVLDPLHGYLLLAKKLWEGKKEYAGAWNFGPRHSSYLPVCLVVKKALSHMPFSPSLEIRRNGQKREAPWVGLHTKKAETLLGWRPVFDFDETIRHTMDWYEHFRNESDMIDVTNQQIRDFFAQALQLS
ncbi:MAG: CDP-glucose 4,6-dehydratase [Candidatus Wildermuthbacteria bacterium]|nr:CDP-glucose 4,6-dehydratase [Parcubacteria group bacterium]MBI2573826.1 CDP-glucose 4,6-dehydratase [Candidatus Wildermuthbacteria bacterium]